MTRAQKRERQREILHIHTHSHTQESNVKMEAEIEVMWPPAQEAKECQKAPEPGGKEGFFSRAFRSSVALPTP